MPTKLREKKKNVEEKKKKEGQKQLQLSCSLRMLAAIIGLVAVIAIVSTIFEYTKSSQLLSSLAGGATSTIQKSKMATSIRTDHPYCFSKDLLSTTTTSSSNSGWILGNSGNFDKWVQRVGKWVKIGRNVTKPVRYTHLCRIMKPRYNCAKNDTSSYKYGDIAT